MQPSVKREQAKILEINGIEVVTQQPAVLPHPNQTLFPNQSVPYRNIMECLLDDGTTRFVTTCCDKTWEGGLSARGHMSSHAAKNPVTKVEVIKEIIRTVKRMQQLHVKNYGERAAEDLNRRNVPSAHGKPWTSGSVSHIFNRYKNTYRVHVAQRHDIPAKKLQEDVPMAASTAVLDAPPKREVATQPPRVNRRHKATAPGDGTLMLRVQQFGRDLDNLGQAFEQLARDIVTAAAGVEVAVEVAEKARKYDEMRNMLK
jgi:hypothetical protein